MMDARRSGSHRLGEVAPEGGVGRLDPRHRGSETSDVWAGYSEGAVRSGPRAAPEVLATLQNDP